jgi:beta-galactosidase beta subunit
MHLIYVLFICGLYIDIQFVLDPYATATYSTSYMTKINKSLTSKLHSISKKGIANNINANIRIQKLGNVFLNAQQMVQLLLTLCFLYHYIIHLEHFNS